MHGIYLVFRKNLLNASHHLGENTLSGKNSDDDPNTDKSGNNSFHN